MLKILFVSLEPFPFGMAGSKRIRLFAEYLTKHNDVKAIVVGKNNGKNENCGIYNSVPYSFVHFNFLQLCLSYLKVYKLLKKEFDGSKDNVLFLYNGIGLNNYIFSFIGSFLKYKIITDIVEDYTFTEENESWKRKILLKLNGIFDKNIIRFTDGIVVISTTLYKKYIDLKIPDKKLTIITVCAENTHLEISKNENELKNFTFHYSGTFGKKDGIQILLQAFISLIKDYPDVRLCLSGKINKSIQSEIANNSQIKYVGLIPDHDYYQFIKNADVLLMTRINSPYANAGFPFKLGEYLATGNPVIATDVSDVRLYLTNKVNVFLIPPSDVNELKEVMIHIINNQDEALRVGLKGKEIAKQHFNPNINGKQLENFIQIICNAS